MWLLVIIVTINRSCFHNLNTFSDIFITIQGQTYHSNPIKKLLNIFQLLRKGSKSVLPACSKLASPLFFIKSVSTSAQPPSSSSSWIQFDLNLPCWSSQLASTLSHPLQHCRHDSRHHPHHHPCHHHHHFYHHYHHHFKTTMLSNFNFDLKRSEKLKECTWICHRYHHDRNATGWFAV